MLDDTEIAESYPLTSVAVVQGKGRAISTALRVDKCTMYLILQFSWPGDVIRIGLSCRWCHDLSLKPELWRETFHNSDMLCSQFCLQNLSPEANTKRTEKLLTPLIQTLKDSSCGSISSSNENTQTAVLPVSCTFTKNDFLHIVRLVSFYSKHTAHQCTLLRLWEEQVTILHWRSYLFAVCAITAGSFISVDFEQPPSDLFYVFGVAFALPFAHSICRILLNLRFTKFFNWRTYQIISITFLCLLWALASFLCYRCTTEFSWACPVSVQVAIVGSSAHIIARLYFSHARICSKKVMGGSLVAGLESVLAIVQVLLVGLKIQGVTHAGWITLWTPTWVALILGFISLLWSTFSVILKRFQRVRFWLIYIALTTYLTLLVFKLDLLEGLEWVHVWIPLLVAECVELVVLLSMCRKQHNRYAEIEILMSDVRKLLWSQEIMISDINVLETLSDYFYSTT